MQRRTALHAERLGGIGPLRACTKKRVTKKKTPPYFCTSITIFWSISHAFLSSASASAGMLEWSFARACAWVIVPTAAVSDATSSSSRT